MHRDLPLLGSSTEDIPTRRDRPSALLAKRIPVRLADDDDIPPSAIDHREGFILSLIDGESTVEELLDLCGMPADEAMATLMSLVDRELVALE
jgi:hypothetical protein